MTEESRVRRTTDQIDQDREWLLDLYINNPGLTQTALTHLFNKIRGTNISRASIATDLKIALQSNMEREKAVELAVQQSIQVRANKLNIQLLMDELDASRKKVQKTVVVEKRPDKDGILHVVKVTETLPPAGINLAIFDRIMKLEAENTKLQGLYLPQRIEIDKTETQVKAYIGVDPDIWKRERPARSANENVIEGQFEN